MITFPANLKEIGERAFTDSGLEEVIFEEGSHLEVIGERVSAGPTFSDCNPSASAVY